MNSKEYFSEWIRRYRHDPVRFIREQLGYCPDTWQCEVANDLAKNKWVTVRSGQGVGKTALAASLMLWFLTVYPFPRVVATAPTQQQLRDVLWSELAKWHTKSPILTALLKWTKTYVFVRNCETRWFAAARVAVRPENMQGFHEDNMLFVVDEASGIRDEIMEAILGTLTGENNKLLMCGNPTRPSGIFYDSHNGKRGDFIARRVNSEDSPRTNKENIDALAKAYGRGSNVYRVRVLGEFPLQDDDVFIPLPLIERSVTLGLDYRPGPKPGLIHMACDVARFGDDKTVIGYKVDAQVRLPEKRRGQDTMKTADRIVELGESLIARYKWAGKIPVKVDDGGVGGGVVDRLRQIKRNSPERFAWLEVFPVTFGTRIKNRHYHDSTSYMTGIVKKLLMPHDEAGIMKSVELLLPEDNNLAAQLSSRKYRLTEASKIQVESKEAMKKRGLPSPDEADCVLLLCLPVRIKGEQARLKTVAPVVEPGRSDKAN
jgi:hypothetical protein